MVTDLGYDDTNHIGLFEQAGNMAEAPDFRNIMQDLLRLGMEGAPGFTNRRVNRIQLEYITNPTGRQPGHIVVFPNGRVDRMTPFQIPVPGYEADVLAVELLGYVGKKPTPEQISSVQAFAAEIRQFIPGRLGFVGNDELVAAATQADSNRPGFMGAGELSFAAQTEAAPKPVGPSTVQALFDILGTPVDRRGAVQPGTLFNNAAAGGGAAAIAMRELFKAPGVRLINRLIVVPSHDAHKPEPTDPSAFTLDALRKNDQRLGMGDFRGHYILARDGSLIAGRDIEKVGNCWPGKNDGSIQIVLAGNGRSPTVEQRQTLYQYGVAMRKHYECPLQAATRDILYADKLLGINPQGMMDEKLVKPNLIEAPIVNAAQQSQPGQRTAV